MHHTTDATGIWWSYAQGNSKVVGLVVLALTVAAIVFVANRVWTRSRRRR